jgi:glycosyltransferase involved in cell wall biosynthesis
MPDKKLVIVGEGNVRKEWESKKRSANIKFMGWMEHDEVVKVMAGAKAFLYAAFEDFGIAPVEAQAMGIPVIAYGLGGTSETVLSGTGLLFPEQTPEALINAINEFEKREDNFSPAECRKNAERFSEEKFVNSIKSFVNEKSGKVIV